MSLQSDNIRSQSDDIRLHRAVTPLQRDAIRLQTDDMLLQLNTIRLQGKMVDGDRDRVAVCHNELSVEFEQCDRP